MVTHHPQIHAGDLLFYNTPGSFVDFVIRTKTWSNVAHVEGYIGYGRSVASRNGLGVNEYDFRSEGLVAILRPIQRFNSQQAYDWFKTVQGQQYDWSGLLCFAFAEWQGSPRKMFCSEFMKRWYEAGGLRILNPQWSADRTAPADLLKSPVMNWVWAKWTQA